MSLTPYSAEALRELRATSIYENRLKRVNEYVTTIYTHVVRRAKETEDTSFKYQFHLNQLDSFDSFDIYMGDIVNRLKEVFPDCSVKHITMSMGFDGKMHNITEIDEKALPFINRKSCQEYIVVDWSSTNL